MKHYAINKYASILHRLGMIYFDHCIEDYELCSGQMIFLLRISEYEGDSILDLAHRCYYDKGTTTRAVQKLEEQGYIYRTTDQHDRRMHHLYLSPKGKMMIPIIKDALHRWEKEVLDGLEKEEIEQMCNILIKMSHNACKTIERMRLYGKRKDTK